MQKGALLFVFAALLEATLWGAESTEELRGRVVDERGRPVVGAEVVATKRRAIRRPGENWQPISVLTGRDGGFRFPGDVLRPGMVVVAAKDGRCVDWAGCLDAMVPDLVLRLGPARTVDGQVVDDGGRPVPGAAVDLLVRLKAPTAKKIFPFGVEPFRAKTDTQGRFRFVNVPPAATVGFDIKAAGRARALADGRFTPGQKGLRFVLPPEGRIEGTVVEKATGQPLADVSVRADVLMYAPGAFDYHTLEVFRKTDKAGHFSFRGLGPGDYDIRIATAGDALPQWFGSQDEVEVDNGETATAHIEAVRGGVLEVVLVDSVTGKPINGRAIVTVAPADDEREGRDGGFAWKGGLARIPLRPGKWTIIEAWGAGFSYKREKGRSFTVRPGKTERAVVRVTSIPKVTLAVRDLTGKAVPGARVQLLPNRGAPKDFTADEDGSLTLDAADVGWPGCDLLVRHPRQNLSAFAVLSIGMKPPQITLRPPMKVSGVVTDARGRPVAGATVQAHVGGRILSMLSTGLPVLVTARTDRAGRYQMSLPPAATYTVSARLPGCTVARAFLTTWQLVWGPVKVKDLVLRSADRTVRGVVKDATGKPVAGAIVAARVKGGPWFPGSAATDDKGQFVLDRLDDSPLIRVFAGLPGRGWDGEATIKPGDKNLTIRVGRSDLD